MADTNTTREILRIARIIDEAPDEWTPHFTRAELLPLARAYLRESAALASAPDAAQRLATALRHAPSPPVTESYDAWHVSWRTPALEEFDAAASAPDAARPHHYSTDPPSGWQADRMPAPNGDCPECGLIVGLHEKGCSRSPAPDAARQAEALREAVEWLESRPDFTEGDAAVASRGRAALGEPTCDATCVCGDPTRCGMASEWRCRCSGLGPRPVEVSRCLTCGAEAPWIGDGVRQPGALSKYWAGYYAGSRAALAAAAGDTSEGRVSS